jgi:hypothetical protein
VQPEMLVDYPNRWRWTLWTSILLIGVSACATAFSQRANESRAGSGGALLDVAPRTWIVDAAANELIALHHKHSYLRYRMHSVNEKGDRVRDTIESEDGTVARLLRRDGKPPTQEEDEGEHERLTGMLASPGAFAKHIRNGDSERKVADRLVPLMPDAGIFSYTPGQPQTGTNNGGMEVVIDYKPNPKFVPPNTEAEALTGLEGRVWIDAKTHYLVRMEGTISHGVNFGWGMLAHIYPGGKLVLNQTDAGGNRWIFKDFSMQLTVRALMVKTLSVNSHVQASDFKTIPAMSYQDAIHLLLAAPLPRE